MVKTGSNLKQTPAPAPGDVLKEQYQIVEMVAQNASHSVYKGIDLHTRAHVALKILAPDADLAGPQWEAILQTLESVRATRRPGLITVFDLIHGRHGDVFIQEWIQGAPLLKLLRSRPLPPIDVLQILHSLARGLDYLQSQNLPSFPFALSDLVIDAPAAPGDDWLHKPLKTWNGYELKIDPLPLNGSRSVAHADAFIVSFSSTLYQMLGGRPTRGSSATGFRPLVSLEEKGNQILRDYIDRTVQAESCGEILFKLAEAEEIALGQIQPAGLPTTTRSSISPPQIRETQRSKETRREFQTAPDAPDPSDIGETESAILAKEAEILELKKALERRMEEKRLAELQTKLEQSFRELEEERARFQRQVASERERLSEENARLENESERLVTEKARQEELSNRLAGLQEEFEREKVLARQELEARRTALDRDQKELQERVEELRHREASIKDQQTELEAQESNLTKRSAELREEQQRREAELTENAARIAAERQEVEASRRTLAGEQAALEKQRQQLAEETRELARLDETLTNRQKALAGHEQSIQKERRELEQSQRQLEERRRSFASQSAELENQLAGKERELEQLRTVSDRSAAQQAQLNELENAKRQIESHRAQLLEHQQQLQEQNEKQSRRLDELSHQHEEDVRRQREELSRERSRYEALIEQLSQREDEWHSKARKQQQAEDQLKDARAKLEEREKETENLRNELQRLETEQANQEKERLLFQQQIVGLQSKIDQLEEDRTKAVQEQASQRDAVAQVEHDQREVETQLKAEFQRRERLLEQQKDAAERQLRKSEDRVHQLRQQEIALREREAQIYQREARASELEDLVERERAARQAEAKRRMAAEKSSRALWTKTAIAVTLASLVLAALGWLWINQGGGRIIREKQLIRQLTEYAEQGQALAILNEAHAFLDDAANEGKDYTLDTGFSLKLRQLLDQSITRLMANEARDLTAYAAMVEQVKQDPEIESPQHFLGLLDNRVALTQAGPLKQRLEQLEMRLNIERETDPFVKVAHIARFLENAKGDAADREKFSQAFREALERVINLEEDQADRVLSLFEGVDFKQTPAPGPLLAAAIEAIALGNAIPPGLTQSAADLINRLLEIESEIMTAETPEATSDRALTERLLNSLSSRIRDGYRALRPHALDRNRQSTIKEKMKPVIDRKAGDLVRLASIRRPELVEFLSFIAEVNHDRRILDALVEEHSVIIPSAMLRALDYYLNPIDNTQLKAVAERIVTHDLNAIRHGREPSSWEGFTRFVKARAYFILLTLKFEKLQTGIQQRSLEKADLVELIHGIEDNLYEALSLRSGYTSSVLRMADTYAKVVQALREEPININLPFHPPTESEISSLGAAAFSALPQDTKEAFAQSLEASEREELTWFLRPPSQDISAWEYYEQLTQGAGLAVSYQLPPFDQLNQPLRRRLIDLFSSGKTE